MISKEGFSGAVKNATSNSPNPTSSSSTLNTVRVVDIIMDENHPRFQELGGYTSIGTIIYEIISPSNSGPPTQLAKPLFPHIKMYPLVGELVILTTSYASIQSSSNFTPTQYYISGVNLWNSPHHNALPNPRKGGNEILNSQNSSQSRFIEKDNIHPILSFTGDVIYEGRYGQSLRFGATSKSTSELKNSWSSVGENGNPITILRNGQSKNIKSDSWVPTTEDVNNDLSTIYLTSTQKIEFDSAIIDKFTEFSPISRATTLNNYFKPQIILNSDRIVINSKSDSVLIGSNRSINLSADEFINVNSQNLYVDAKHVLLGNKNASESLILGDSFMRDFNLLLSSINNLCTVLESDMSWPGGIPSPNSPVNTAASSLKYQVEDIQNKILKSSFTSKTSKTI